MDFKYTTAIKRIRQMTARKKVIQGGTSAGKRKYGTTMERDDLTFIEWIQHLQEELMDAVVYIEKVKNEIR